MTNKKNNEAKFTAWTMSGTRVEMNGNIAGCAIEMFGLVAGAEAREKVLKFMQERHEKLKEHGV